MKKGITAEVTVGIFIIVGFLALVYLAFNLGEVSLFSGNKNYTITAEFDNISGVKKGAAVQISGVQVGQVSRVWLEEGYANIEMVIDNGVKLSEDTIASVKTQGIIGDKYIQLTPGGDEALLGEGGHIIDTESALDIESLISKFAFGSVK